MNKMIMPHLTIGIPTLNRGYCLEKSINSALWQTYKNIEVIVSDNASTDNTADILAAFHDSRIREIRQTKTIDAVSNWNAILSEARGRLFMILSDDDWIEPTFAESMISLFDKNPMMSMGYCQTIVHSENSNQMTRRGPELEKGVDFLLAAMSMNRDVAFCATVMHTRLLKECGGYRLENFGDALAWVEMSLKGSVGCVCEPLSHYTWNMSCSSATLDPYSVLQQHKFIVEHASKGLREKSVPTDKILQVRHEWERYVVKSLSDLFLKNGLSGIAKRYIWHSFIMCFPFLMRHPRMLSVPAVFSALFVPRGMISKLLNINSLLRH